MSFQEPKNALVERRELLLLAAVVGIPLLLRLLVAITPTCISSDGVSYVDIAKQIARGGDWFHPIFPPGYSLLIAAVHTLLGGSFEQIGRYISSAAGALVIIPAWFVWRSAYGAVAAGFSCLLFTMSPLSVELGGACLHRSRQFTWPIRRPVCLVAGKARPTLIMGIWHWFVLGCGQLDETRSSGMELAGVFDVSVAALLSFRCPPICGNWVDYICPIFF